MQDRAIITKEHPKSPMAEAYRTLRTNIQFSNIDKDIKCIIITSSGPGEGKSTTIVNLAVTMAQNGKKVLLIDGDLRKPKLHMYFRLHNQEGLTKLLAHNIEYNEVIQSTDIENLYFLASGPIPPNPSELLGSNKMRNFLNALKEEYDMILIDTPPVSVITDAAVLSTIADGTILVCAVGQASIDGAKLAKEMLQKVNANILGVVLNKIPINEGRYYKYNHYLNYYDVDEDSRKKLKKVKAQGVKL